MGSRSLNMMAVLIMRRNMTNFIRLTGALPQLEFIQTDPRLLGPVNLKARWKHRRLSKPARVCNNRREFWTFFFALDFLSQNRPPTVKSMETILNGGFGT